MFYDPDRNVEYHRRNLPHWGQTGVVSFITFRLADSIPKKALQEWEAEQRIWLSHRLSSPSGRLNEILGQLSEDDRREYLRKFGKRFHELLDSGHGSCVLRQPTCSALVERALLHFDGDRYLLGNYVVMPNHIHLLLLPSPDHEVPSIVGSWKKFSAREINKLTGKQGHLWQVESFDHLVRSAGSLEGFRRYIRENPEKASLREGEYRLGCGKLK